MGRVVLKRPGFMAPKSGFEPPTYRLTAGCSTVELLRNSIFAATYSPRLLPSTISAEGLNFCVRYGNRCFPFAFATKIVVLSKLHNNIL